ncbi:amino acid adenylation domain-containing protein [Massilia sp. GCM10020059]|uniref:Amino acid adenylation domain-containing protein n=1 Tax=Massilia agrisoli TaxID=2892444 RepID=A0ABS8INK1_9BURK|nr:amino acid adenylation domain-containing protein [Massilia agrisoli]MCC6069966.1 amino acid adenylation domain-containing protein [Massilia agrisoli]
MAFVSNIGLAFEEVVRRHHDRTALLYPATEETVSYGKLAALATAIAGELVRQGVQPGDVVAMFHDKSPPAYAAMLACLRLGVIYTNLDPDSPWARLEKILHTCQPRLIVNSFSTLPYQDALEQAGTLPVLDLQAWSRRPLADSEALPDAASVGGQHPAYIMFTSGSTGMPKGAAISHANLLWFIGWAHDRFAVTQDDVMTNANPMYFDNSVFDFYTALFAGATLVPLTAEQVREPRTLVKLVNQARCSIWFSVPSLLVYLLTTRALAAKDFPAMRAIVFGGEGFPKTRLKQLFDLFGARTALENVYGPTECTCICSAHRVEAVDFDDMTRLATLGSIAQNFSAHILPLDAAAPQFGELFLAGPHVGLGYYNDPERTSRSFIQNPANARYPEVGYRTGDLVERDENGKLHFKGRQDFQIKHMGYRIELEEIEAALNTLPNVKECAVVYRKLAEGLGEIVAFAAADDAGVTAESLLSQLAALLPAYMVPRKVNVMAQLPKNANGKIDRVSLQSAIQERASQ